MGREIPGTSVFTGDRSRHGYRLNVWPRCFPIPKIAVSGVPRWQPSGME
jgi:hypothetical protein